MECKTNGIKFALNFPQGLILFMESGAAYFQPQGSHDAFIIWGERKELFGKKAITVAKDRDTGGGDYSVVYEFSDQGGLQDARLVKGEQTVRGTLVTADVLDVLNQEMAAGNISLHRRQEVRKIFNVARFSDGRLLVQITPQKELYLGTPGNFEKVDAQAVLQGGNSVFYKHADGFAIKLPYGYGGPNGEAPMYGDQYLGYMNVESGTDPAEFGLVFAEGLVFREPFSAAVPTAPKKVHKPGRF